MGIAQGAALIAVLTLLSRILGLGRTLVFSQTVGSGCLGTVYTTAYQIPNLVSELVLAGALTNALVPVLARSAARAHEDPRERSHVSQITSAMLTWTVLLLVPVTIAVALAAGPIAGVLNPSNANAHCARPDMVAGTAGMLRVFAPQVLLWGLSVVMFGVLQAYRRFTGPAVGPIVANVVMIASYLVFVPLDGGRPLGSAPEAALLALSVGATANVAMLVVTVLWPMARLRLRLRPTLRLPSGVAGVVGGLVAVGVAEFVVNDVVSVLIIIMANGHGDTGALVIFNYAQLVFTAVLSVLTASITTSAFPVLSGSDGEAFDRTCAGSTRAVVLMSWLGTALIVTVAVPAAQVLVHPSQTAQLVEGFIAFAPGIAGTAVITNLSRAMFALGKLRVAGAALTANWIAALAIDALLTWLLPARLEVAALAVGNTAGQVAVAIPLIWVTRRLRGPAAVAGVWRASVGGLVACVAACAAGAALVYVVRPGGLGSGLPLLRHLLGVEDVLQAGLGAKAVDVAVAAMAAVGATITFVIASLLVNRRDVAGIAREVMLRYRRAGRHRVR